jgi:hypothetical protein
MDHLTRGEHWTYSNAPGFCIPQRGSVTSPVMSAPFFHFLSHASSKTDPPIPLHPRMNGEVHEIPINPSPNSLFQPPFDHRSKFQNKNKLRRLSHILAPYNSFDFFSLLSKVFFWLKGGGGAQVLPTPQVISRRRRSNFK